MGMFKFDMNKIKQKLEDDKKKYENAKGKKKERDITQDPLVKVAAAGEYNFRAVPYIHNKDFISDPFPERFYHFGIPGAPIFYCPAMNSNRKHKCAVCDFVWERMKEYKGNKEEITKWRKFLPQKRVWIPGILRGRESEGLKYFPLSTLEDKMGKHHEQLFKWLQGKLTYFMLDPENGLDLILKYEAYDAARSAALNGAKFGFNGFDLDRESTPISDNVEELWSEIETTMRNIDTDLPRYETKTEKDSEDVLDAWFNAETKKAKGQVAYKPVDQSKDTDGAEVAAEVEDDDKPVTIAKTEAKEATAEQSADTEDRKAKARRLLNKMPRD